MTRTRKAAKKPQLDPERLARVLAALKANGYESLSQAARAANLDYATLHRIVHRGISANPRHRTVSALAELGILEAVGHVA